MIKKPRKKKCKACGEVFQPERQFQEVCKPFPCSLDLARIKAKKKEDREHRERKKDLKPIAHWLKETQFKAFNPYILKRDKERGCMSCGTYDCEEFHAGHLRSIGAASQLRFNEDNCWKQCSKCNTHLSGNREQYEINLRWHIGNERVDALINDNTTRTWTREELEEMRKVYRAKIKELEAQL